MKKLILRGKQLLSKKLEELDIQTTTIDFAEEQTPTKLKPCLEILKTTQIDLQDSHTYDTYFKNYPNHHISHYLLDKMKQLGDLRNDVGNGNGNGHREENNDSNRLGYQVPQTEDYFVPKFDEFLERKGLDFKEAVQEYEQGFNKLESALVCICVINFHHKRGTQIEYKYPDSSHLTSIYDNIVHHAMPDSSHLRDSDCNFFNFQLEDLGKKRMLFGVSYFKQVLLTEQMKKNNKQFTRSHVQKAIAIISLLPLFEYLKMRLENMTQVFFDDFTNFQIIQQAYESINYNLGEAWPNIQLSDLYMGCDLENIVVNFGIQNLYEIWKAVLYQKRVVIFAQTSSDASSFILSLLSLFPGLSCFGLSSKPISRYLQGLRQYALPLRIFSSQNILAISFHVQDFNLLARYSKNDEGNFLVGTTNRLLIQANDYGIQMIVNLEEKTIAKNKSRRPWQTLSKKEKSFISELKDCFNKSVDKKLGNCDELVRGWFHEFLKGGLVHMISGIKQYQTFVVQCKKYEKNSSKSQKSDQKKRSSYELMEDEDQCSQVRQACQNHAPEFPQETSNILFPQLLLNKSFAYFRQFANTNLPLILGNILMPSVYVNEYEYIWQIDQQQRVVYNWLQKRLQLIRCVGQSMDCKQIKYKFTPFLQIQKDHVSGLEMSSSIYIGGLNNGKYFGYGFYVDQGCRYEGEFLQGDKNGYGKYSGGDEKYIGNFKCGLYEGEGQLVKSGLIYAGGFKKGLKHGYGSMQGDAHYSGQWKYDRPCLEGEKDDDDKQKQKNDKQKQKSKQKEDLKKVSTFRKKS